MDDLTGYWEDSSREYHVDVDGDGEADANVWTLQQLKDALGDGDLSTPKIDTEVWVEGLESWTRLGDLLRDIYGEDGAATWLAESDGPHAFWKSCTYQYELPDSGTSERLTLAELQARIAEGEVADDTFVIIDEAKGTLGEMKETYDGLEEALLMAFDGGDDDGDSANPAEHWMVSEFFFRLPGASTASKAKCIGEMQELMLQGYLTDDTEVWTNGLHDWMPIAQLLEEEQAFADSMMLDYPTSVVWVDTEGAEHTANIADFRAGLRSQAFDDETQVFVADHADGFVPLAECRALLGLAASMDVYGSDDEEPDDGDEHSAPHLGEQEIRAVEAAMTKHGIGAWRRAKRVASMALMRARSRTMFDVIRQAGQSGAIEVTGLSALKLRRKRHERQHTYSQRAKMTIHIEEIALDMLRDVHQTSVHADCGRESAKTPVHVVTDGHVGWLGFSFDFHVREINDDTQLVFSIDLPTEQSRLSLELSLLADGNTRRLTIPFTGAAAGELAFTATLLGATPAENMKHKKRVKQKAVATTGQAPVSTPAVEAASSAGGGAKPTSTEGLARFKRSARVAMASTRMVRLSANAQSAAAAEIATTLGNSGKAASPMGKLLAKKMESGELRLDSKLSEAAVVAAPLVEEVGPQANAISSSFEDTIAKVRQPLGGVNWLLCEANASVPTVVSSGIGSIKEMQQAVHSSQVYYGFGSGKFRRTKWCFVHWSGDEVGAVLRGKLNGLRPEMQKLLTPRHLCFDATQQSELDIEPFIRWMLSVIVSDDLDTDVYTVDGFMEALQEEKQLQAVTDANETQLDSAESDEDYTDEDDESDEEDEPVRVRTRPLPTDISTASAAGREPALIVDLGYGSCKFGMEGEDAPSRLPCRSQARRDLITREQYLLSSILLCQSLSPETAAIEPKPLLMLRYSMMNVDWVSMEALWEHIFNVEIDLPADECIVSCTVSPYGPNSYATTLGEILFEELEVPSLYFAVPGIQCLYAHGLTSGLVLDSGTCITSAIPVIDGFCVKHAVQTLPFGGRDITERLAVEANIATEGNFRAFEIVDAMKQSLCSINEPPCSTPAPEKSHFVLPDGSTIDLTEDLRSKCRELPGQFFFDPSQTTFDTGYEGGVDKIVLNCLKACSIDTRAQLLNNFVVAGGNTYIHGFSKALHAQLKEHGGNKVAHLKKIVANKDRDASAWRGGCVLASLSSWHDELVNIDDYYEDPDCVLRMNILSMED